LQCLDGVKHLCGVLLKCCDVDLPGRPGASRASMRRLRGERGARRCRRHRRLPRPFLPPRVASTPLPLLRQHQPPWPLTALDLGSGRRRGGEEGRGHGRPKSRIRACADVGATTLRLGLRRRRAEEQEREGGGGEVTSGKRSEVRVREVLREGGVGVDLLGWWEGVFAKCARGALVGCRWGDVASSRRATDASIAVEAPNTVDF
jgi:hypothetical protein